MSSSSPGLSTPTSVGIDMVVSFMNANVRKISDLDLKRLSVLDGIGQISILDRLLKDEIKRREGNKSNVNKTSYPTSTSVQSTDILSTTSSDRSSSTPPTSDSTKSENGVGAFITFLVIVGIIVVGYFVFF